MPDSGNSRLRAVVPALRPVYAFSMRASAGRMTAFVTLGAAVPGRRARAGLLVALALLPATLAANGLEVEIRGLDEERAQAVRAGLTAGQYADRPVDEAAARRLAAKGTGEIREALEAFGYYGAEVTTRVDRGREGKWRALFTVQPGDPVIIRRSHVDVAGPAAEVDEVRAALAAFRPREGERLEHRLYEQSKTRISNALRATGFLAARMVRQRVEVASARRSAEVSLVWDSGPRHRFGDVTFSAAQFPDEFLRRFVPWQEGEFYSAQSLLTLQQRLVSGDYFASVSVRPGLDHIEDETVPVEVMLVPDKRTVYSAGLFVSTDSGPGGRLGVDRRWVNQRGHKASAEVAYAQHRQEASVDYRIPRPGVEPRDYTVGAAYTKEVTESVESRNLRIAVAAARRNWRGFTRTVGLHYLDGDFEIAEQRGASRMTYAETSLSRRRVDEDRHAGRGYSVRLALRGAPAFALADTSFLQGQATGEWSRLAGVGRIILRTELGAMAVDDFHALPPQLRFFAGGDRSVRGFGFQAIGDTNAAGGVVGGKFLVTAGVEYEHYFRPAWGAAVFVDAGDAFRAEFSPNVGAGVGLRWKSPIGTVRLDLARPVVSDFGESWRVHLVIGPTL